MPAGGQGLNQGAHPDAFATAQRADTASLAHQFKLPFPVVAAAAEAGDAIVVHDSSAYCTSHSNTHAHMHTHAHMACMY